MGLPLPMLALDPGEGRADQIPLPTGSQAGDPLQEGLWSGWEGEGISSLSLSLCVGGGLPGGIPVEAFVLSG